MSTRRPQQQLTHPRSYYLGAAALILVGLVLGLGLSAGLDVSRDTPIQKPVHASSPALSGAPESPFVAVVERALPAVVYIDVKRKVAAADSENPHEDLFRRFFGDVPRRRQVAPSTGSGFIIDKQGHILTNNHVVRDANEINVTLNDRRTFKAKVVGTDPETDVAVVKIEADDLPTVPLGDSDALRVGDWAIAIGNPLGQLRGSVTVGIISAQGRTDLNIWGGTPSYQDFIQTDASINFGNSGGPLCNIRGEAIGINTAINPSGQGIGFAIPINLARHVAEQLVASGQVKRAWMGIMPAELTPELAEGFGIRGTQGILVQNVVDDTPAARAGFKRNDVIVEFDGQAFTDVTKFRLKVADTKVGKRVPVVVLRDGKRRTLYVTLGERTEQALAQVRPGGRPAPVTESFAGLEVRDLTAEEKSNARLSQGVMVTSVEEGSVAEEAGVREGDIIEEVGGKPVTSAEGFANMLSEVKGTRKHAVLLVNSGGAVRYVPLRLE